MSICPTLSSRRSTVGLSWPWIVAVLPAMLFWGGCQHAPTDVVQKKDASDQSVVVKTVAVTQSETRKTTRQPATVHAYHAAELFSRATGYVRVVQADIGDFVEANATLAELDVPDLHQQHAVLLARVARLEAEQERAASGVDLADAAIAAARANLGQSKSLAAGADASLAVATAEYQRTRDMVNRGSLQARNLDEAIGLRDSRAADRESVGSQIRSSQAEVDVAKAKKAAAEADLTAAEAETEIAKRELDLLQVSIAYATIKAPFAGIVTHRGIDPGDLVREHGSDRREPLFVISQTDRVRVHVPVPETDAPSVNRGDAIQLTFPSFVDEPPMVAEVTRTTGILDPNTRTMMVETVLDNSSGKLIPGMFGQATIELDSRVAAAVLPARAVRFDEPGNAYVYAINDQDTVQIVPVRTGADNGSEIEILEGLSTGQVVIDAHLKRFIDGQKVAVMETSR